MQGKEECAQERRKVEPGENSLSMTTILFRKLLQGNSHDNSREEIEELQRSTKRFNENPKNYMGSTAPPDGEELKWASYKDKLTGLILRAFEQAFQIERSIDDDSDDDVPPEEDDGAPRILLTRQEKLQIRARGETRSLSSLLVNLWSIISLSRS